MELRSILLKVWSEAYDLEIQRIEGIQNLYEEIVKSNQSIFGPDTLKNLVLLRS